MQAEDGFRRHLASYRIDGFPLHDIHHLTRARSTRRITVPNAAYGFGVRSSAIAEASRGTIHLKNAAARTVERVSGRFTSCRSRVSDKMNSPAEQAPAARFALFRSQVRCRA